MVIVPVTPITSLLSTVSAKGIFSSSLHAKKPVVEEHKEEEHRKHPQNFSSPKI